MTSATSTTSCGILNTAHPYCAPKCIQVVVPTCTATNYPGKVGVAGRDFFKFLTRMETKEVKRKLFIWKRNHEMCLLKEVLYQEPYARKQSERGVAWRAVAASLNNNPQHVFKVTERSCRDRFTKIMTEFKSKENKEQNATGIDAEYDEYWQACQDIKDRMEEVASQEEAESAKKMQEAEQASQIRQTAMESLSATRKRKNCGEGERKARRRRGGDTMMFLQQSMEKKAEQQKAEQNLRERELKLREAELKQQKEQQQMQNQFMMHMFQQLTDILKHNKST